MLIVFAIVALMIFKIIYFKKSPRGLYRIADLIFYPAYLVNNDYDTTYMLEEYPDSIGTKYMLERFPCLKNKNPECKENVSQNNNVNRIDTGLLISLIKKDRQYKKYSRTFSSDELVLHVRIGDVLCMKDTTFYDSGKTFGQMYAKYGDTEWWNQVKEYITSNVIQKVYLVYGSHTKTCTQESEDYIRTIKETLECPTVDVNNTADQDLMFCLNAKHFITTG